VNLFKIWAQHRRQVQYDRGFEYGAGVCLRQGMKGVDMLVEKNEEGHTFGDRDEFDEGMIAACLCYVSACGGKDVK